jgi:cytoskeletal protein CcmA (bactofilin family)
MTQEPRITKIAEGAVVKGEISFPGGKLRIEGELHGNVTSVESVEIAPKGKLVGDVQTANEIDLQGAIQGNTKTKKMTIRPSGVLTGNLDVEQFIMEEGGKILGEVKMNVGDVKDTWKPSMPKSTSPQVEVASAAAGARAGNS